VIKVKVKSTTFNVIFALAIIFILFSCGGGDGGKVSIQSNITLNKDAVDMNMERLGRTPSDQIVVSSSNPNVKKYGFKFVDGTPEWLDAHLGAYEDILLGAETNELPLGHYEITVRVFVADNNDSIIATKDIKITLGVVDEFIITAIPASLTFSGPENTVLPEQVVTFDSNTGTYPYILAVRNKINDWLTVTNAENYRSVTVTITPQPIGTYEDKIPLIYYFNGSARWLNVPVVYNSQK
jgi:hypothetical protein